MERLTFEGNFCDIAQCRENPCPCNGSCSKREVWARLKAYEDTGLTPAEVLPKDKADEIALKLMRLADLESFCSYTRLRELAEADKEGHVVVLPCKVGDTVYVSYGEGYRPCIIDRIHVLANNDTQIRARHLVTETLWISASAFGKTVFLTREEAEKALKETKDD